MTKTDINQLVKQFCQTHYLDEGFAVTAQKWFIPLAQQIALHNNGADGTVFIGINGCQGSGKSTLTDFLEFILTQNYQLQVASMSLDDFYLTKAQRNKLADKVHPLLQTRGVPGTHDTHLLSATLEAFRDQHYPIAIPRFNKLIDDRVSQHEWAQIEKPVDVVIVEGWCWGVMAQDEKQLIEPVNDFESQYDCDGKWRNYVNHQLTQNYAPLYQYFSMWIMLAAPSFDQVFDWRKQQELRLVQKSTDTNVKPMNDEELNQFIQFYQRLTEHSLSSLPPQCDFVFYIDEARHIISADGKSALTNQPLQTTAKGNANA